PSDTISTSNQRVNSKACSQIPYAAEQGIFAAITGNFFEITGKFNRASSEIAELLSGVEFSTALDVNSALLRHSKIGGLPAFGRKSGCSGHRRRCARISRGTAPRFLLAVPAQPGNRAARGRAL